jgi:hypothetical protein
VHPQNRGNFWPATAALVVHVEPRRIPLVIGGDRFPARLVIKTRMPYFWREIGGILDRSKNNEEVERCLDCAVWNA